LENGKKVEIQAKQSSTDQVYVDQLQLNGKNYTHNFLKYDDLLKGAVLDFTMSSQPNKTRGTKAENAPYSLSKEVKSKK